MMSMQHAPTPTATSGSIGADDRVGRTMLGIAIVWFGVCTALGASGFLYEHHRVLGPLAVVPLIAFVVVFAASPRIRTWALTLDTRALVLLHAIRTGAGIAFLILYADGRLHGGFALPAGWGDFIVGVTAVLAAVLLVPARSTMQRGLLTAWMIPGIAELAVAIVASSFLRISNPANVMALNVFPLSIVPTFFVPLVLIDYVILGAQLWRQRGSA